jgi:hypothetical protein
MAAKKIAKTEAAGNKIVKRTRKPKVQAKVFFDRSHGYGGGYVIGEGKLPDGFDPDDFIARFGRAIITKCAPTDEEIIEKYGEEMFQEVRGIIDALINESRESVHAAVAAAPVITGSSPMDVLDELGGEDAPLQIEA